MENLKVALLLHFYQPWWQAPEILGKIAEECYRPIVKLIKEAPGFCFSANVNYSLFELLDRGAGEPDDGFILDDFRDITDGFKKAAEERKIELLGSTAYHPIMPLIPRDLQILQMMADSEFKKSLWGIERNCGGIFLPEMAWSQSMLPNLQKCGYRWTVLDDVCFKAQYGFVPYDEVPGIRGGFKAFLRSNYWSNQIADGKLTFKIFREKLNYEFPQWTKNRPAYLVIALDAETFGHHHPRLIKDFLQPMLKEWGSDGEDILMPFEKISQLFPAKTLVRINDGSWSTSADDYWRDNSFPLWNSKFNPHHQNLWRLVNLALRHFGNPEADASRCYGTRPETNLDCLKITSSCQWWWISGRPWWNPDLMKFGARKAMEIVECRGSPEEISEAKKIFDKLDALN